jgi:threonine aldolase
MKMIDLRSDTVTMPSPEMRDAIFNAELGDDGYREDPTVNKLQERIAEMLGKEAALFVVSGTMGNLISILTHCRRGEQVILGNYSHHAVYEQGGSSALGGVSTRTVPNLPDGRLELSAIEASINPDDPHFARTKLISLENTWNGHPLTPQYMKEVRQIADKHELKVHLDGARIFNAALALRVSPRELVTDVDSVQLCFSKGLACPAGSIIAGDTEFIAEARRLRQCLGGRLRQVGILAAACLVALDKMIDRLAEDHANARQLAEGLAELPGIIADPGDTHTNIVFFHTALPGITPPEFLAQLKAAGVRMGWMNDRVGFRAVTHYGIDHNDVVEALQRVKEVIARLQKEAAVSR